MMQNYLDLHRHAAVAARLLDMPGVALLLMLAHAIGGSGLWQVRADPRTAKNEGIAKSVSESAAEEAIRARRAEIAALLGFEEERVRIVGGNGDASQTVAIFARLLALSDDDVLRILTLVMAETLEAGSAVVEAAGVHLNLDLRGQWQADDAFLELVRDRPAINALLESVAGKGVADGNLADKAKDQRQIIRDCLDGANGRAKVELAARLDGVPAPLAHGAWHPAQPRGMAAGRGSAAALGVKVVGGFGRPKPARNLRVITICALAAWRIPASRPAPDRHNLCPASRETGAFARGCTSR